MGEKLNEFLSSNEFKIFKDEDLREKAIEAVNAILKRLRDENLDPPARSQVNSIFATLQTCGMSGLEVLAEKQKAKEQKKEKDKANMREGFWALLCKHIADQNDPCSLSGLAHTVLAARGFVKDHSMLKPPERGSQKTLNKQAIKAFLDAIALIYFEHFICHFYYCHKGGNNGQAV